MLTRYRNIMEKVLTNIKKNDITEKPGDTGIPPPSPPKDNKPITKINLNTRDAMANKANNIPSVIINPEDQSLTRTTVNY